jgi:uncharacterized protein YaaN involved in tellurite resistance
MQGAAMTTTTNLPVAAGKNLDLAVRELSLDVSTAGDAGSKADRDRIAAIKQGIDIADTTAVLQYGANVQNTIAEFADSVLQTVTTKDSGEVGQRLTDLLLKIKGLDVESLTKTPGFLNRLFGSIEREIRTFIGRYEKVGGEIDRVVLQLESAKDGLLRDLVMLDKLFDKNLDNFHGLNLHIQAGEQIVGEMRDKVVPKLEAEAKEKQGADGQFAAQHLADMRQQLDRFEKKIADLRLSKTVALQTMPQIRLIQNNDAVLVEKLQSSIINTIPIWKNQIVIAISLLRQNKALELQRDVTNTTNEMLTRNAELLKEGSVAVATESNRGIVDVETLQKVNQDLIATIDEVMRIQAEGRDKRKAAEAELARIESDLKARLARG